MKLFGYTVSKEKLHHHPDFDSLAEPFYHPGIDVGFLVLHGIGGTPATVRIVSDRLAEAGYTVYAPTLPGHGTTVADLNKSSWKDWLSTAEGGYGKLLNEGCRKIIPVGLSLGAILSAYLASERECAGAILLSPPFRMRPFLRFSRHISFLVPFVSSDPERVKHVRESSPYGQMYEGFSTSKLNDLQILIRKTNERLPKIKCPVFAIWAEQDNKVDPKSKEILKRGLISAPLTEYTLEGSPHGSTYGPKRDQAAETVMCCVKHILEGEPNPCRP